MPNKSGVARTALLVILGPEAVFFGMLLMVYLSLRFDQVAKPFAADPASHLIVPVINTAILLVSGLTAWRSLVAVRRDDTPALQTGLLVTVALGLVFIAGQVFEFNRSGMQPGDPTYGGIFFTLIGFHALHVLAGMFIQALNLWRAHQGDFSANSHTAIEVGAWFWFFVIAVWLSLFLALYVM